MSEHFAAARSPERCRPARNGRRVDCCRSAGNTSGIRDLELVQCRSMDLEHVTVSLAAPDAVHRRALGGRATRDYGRRLNLVGDVECPVGESRGDGKRCLRVEFPHDEGQRSESAHKDGDANEHVCSGDSVDHGGSPIPFATKVGWKLPRRGDEVYQNRQVDRRATLRESPLVKNEALSGGRSLRC